MNEYYQRAAIASRIGWKVFPYVVINGHRREVETWVEPHKAELFNPNNPGPGCFAGALPPNYPSDLNAMHEAEKTLSEEEWIEYIENLKSILKAHANSYRSVKAKIHATAAQKAEAFLKALNLWKT